MNLDELQSVQARERQSSDLQHLRASFYREVGEYVQGLSAERARLVEAAEDPFSSPEVRQLTDDIETAEQTVEAIYERRVGKVVKKASIAAAGMPVDADGLTEEEETLFEDLVARIEGNRETVLSVLDAEGSEQAGAGDVGATGSDECLERETPDADSVEGGPEPARAPGGEPDADGVSAADLMGSADADRTDDGEATGDAVDEEDAPGDDLAADPLAADPDDGPTEVPPDDGPPGEPDARGGDGSTEPSRSDETGADDPADEARPDPTSADRDVPGTPRTTVRITADVGEVVGADDRDYDLGPEDVVTLPTPNADVLIEKDAAERLE